ncbi:MAG: hypothetical protein KatS3mg102_1078 [Planctomycetota bacterium]|nr:MAG: hypothetical protein KatS3mg102_1078 [Planctomycetota bacterium]
MRRPAPGASRGFTLIELLVAVAVAALLVTLVGTILVSLLEHDRELHATLLEERVGSAILELVARDLKSAYAHGLSATLLGLDRGTADELHVLTARPQSSAVEGAEPGGAGLARFAGSALATGAELHGQPPPEPLRLAKVSYVLRPSRSAPGYLALLRAEQPYQPPAAALLPALEAGSAAEAAASARGPRGQRPRGPAVFEGSPDLGQAQVFEVYDKVRAFELRYVRADGQVLTEWREPAELPVAIQIQLQVVPDPRRAGQQLEAGGEPPRTYQTVIALPIAQP